MNVELWEKRLQGADLGMLPILKKLIESTNNS